MLNIQQQKLHKDLLAEAIADNGLANIIASRYGQEGKEAIESYRIMIAITCGTCAKIGQDNV